MTKRNKKVEAQRAVTTRLPLGDYMALLSEAEEKGTTVADVLRLSWARYHADISIRDQISAVESRLTRRCFEFTCAIADITEEQRIEAWNKAWSRLKEKQR